MSRGGRVSAEEELQGPWGGHARGDSTGTRRGWGTRHHPVPKTRRVLELLSCIPAKSARVGTVPEKLQIQPLAHLV